MAGVPYNPGTPIAQAKAALTGGPPSKSSGGGKVYKGTPLKPNNDHIFKKGANKPYTGGGTDWDAFIADLLGQYGDGGGGGGGGYGGGGGGGVDISAVLAAARAKYNETDAKLGDLYGDLAKTYEPLPGQTKTRYDQALAANSAETTRIVQANQQRTDQEAQAAAAAAARLGISGPAPEQAETAKEAQYGNQQLQLQSQNWAGLMGTARESQVGRDNANLQGARDAGTLARDELRKQYDEYVAGLQAQAASGGGGGGGGYGGGGGSRGSSTGNKLLDKMNEAMLVYALAQKGVYSNAWSASAYKKAKPSIYEELGISPSAYNKAASQYAAGGTNTAAKAIQGGMSPAVAAALRKQFG